MNRFERLFFILEKYDNSLYLSPGDPEPAGVIKITITDKIRIAVEISNLPRKEGYLYDIVLFYKNKYGEYLEPKIIDVQCSESGTVKDNIAVLYEGQSVFGAALTYKNVNNQAIRYFPLVSFKVKQDEWRKYLNDLNISETKVEQVEKNTVKHQEVKKPEEILKHSNYEKSTEENKSIEPSKHTEPSKSPEVKKPSKDESLHKYFSTYDPFDTTNKSYRWWRGIDMHNINKVLIEIGVKLPFELNKEGYIACEVFGHILLGIYKDKEISREFFILGIPAKERSGAGNYYSNSRWEECTMQQSSGESGYWLTYIDCETSKVVKVV